MLLIDIESSAGVKQGSGPLATATSWRTVRRLDRAGTFAFTLPAEDPQRSLATAKRVARARLLRTGRAPLEVGAGVIDSRTLRAGPDGAAAEISGDDLLRELTYRTVGTLALRDLSTRAADTILHNDDPGGANTFTAKTPAFTITLTADDYLYIGDADPFSVITIDVGATVNAVEAVLSLAYWDGASWTELDISDGTYSAAKTLRQDGVIEFERQLDWVTTTVNAVSAYWVRLQASKDLTAAINITTLTISQELPTADALADILAYAPAGWSLDVVDGYSATAGLIYAKFGGESVLAALVMVAEALGEHFILNPGAREVRWLQTTLPASGLRAVADVDPIAAEGNDAIVLLTELEHVADTYDLCTRIYPYGAGNGVNRIDLTDSDWSPPAGYTIDTTNNYIQSTAGVAAYGVIERAIGFAEIGAQANTYADIRLASNQLAQAAYAYLSRADTAHEAYTCRVVKAADVLLPGTTIPVVYQRWRDGEHVIDIDATLYILEATDEIGPDGVRTTGLTLATVDRWPSSDADLGVSALETGQVLEAYAQGTMAYSVAGPYVRRVDATHPAEFTCRIGPEVTDLHRATLRFRTQPLTSSIKTIAGSSTTTASGGGATVTSASGGGSTVTSASGGGTTVTSATGGALSVTSSAVDLIAEEDTIYSGSDGSHDHDGATSADSPTDPHSHTISSDGSHTHAIGHEHSISAHSHLITAAAHDHSVTVGNHTHSVTVADHTHSVTVADHTHTLTPNISTTYGLYTDTDYPTGLSVTVDGVDVTAAIGGPWATASEAVEVEAEIGAYLRAAPGGLRQRHRIVVSATGGQGEVECEVAAFVVVQAIAV